MSQTAIAKRAAQEAGLGPLKVAYSMTSGGSRRINELIGEETTTLFLHIGAS